MIKNHERNAAAIYPCLFVARRVLKSILIVQMATGNVKPFFGTLVLTFVSFAVLCYVVAEKLWEQRIALVQHLANEAVYYCLCVGLVCFSGVVSDAD